MSTGWTRLAVVAAVAVAAWALTIGQMFAHRTPSARGTTVAPTPVPSRAPIRAAPTPVVAVQATPVPAPTPTATPSPAAYVVRRVLDVPEPMHHGDWFWDEAGAPAGEIVITVDLAAQVLSVFRGGYEIGTAVILYGADAKPTPLGVHPVLMKDADHRSRTYGNAPMPYTLRLTGDGVAIHGTTVKDGYMTHGCIGVPTPFAKRLFGVTPVGTKVIVTRGERLAVGGAIKAA